MLLKTSSNTAPSLMQFADVLTANYLSLENRCWHSLSDGIRIGKGVVQIELAADFCRHTASPILLITTLGTRSFSPNLNFAPPPAIVF